LLSNNSKHFGPLPESEVAQFFKNLLLEKIWRGITISKKLIP
jgi:hypothetical protein